MIGHDTCRWFQLEVLRSAVVMISTHPSVRDSHKFITISHALCDCSRAQRAWVKDFLLARIPAPAFLFYATDSSSPPCSVVPLHSVYNFTPTPALWLETLGWSCLDDADAPNVAPGQVWNFEVVVMVCMVWDGGLSSWGRMDHGWR